MGRVPECVELLAPARTADIGIEAIRHGADAVYIGASRFGARAAAGNSIEDIRRLVAFARPFGARVYATVNTLLYKEELPAAEGLLWELGEAGVSAFIVQDPAVAALVRKLWPGGDGPRLHASTQMDNRTAERVAELTGEGYEQVVLARELSLADLADIHRQCPGARLEVFVHGALCVSLSGRCYASEALCGRSANRGECAQICRLPFDLEDEAGRKIVRGQHLLSLKDLCLLDSLGDLLEAGARSLKIEGRLKDMGYVKNVTAAYSQALDEVIAQHPGRWRRASRGEVSLRFTQDVRKSFNRGFTHYFLHGRGEDTSPQGRIFSPHTPKSIGEPVGRVRQVLTDSLVTDGRVAFANGDGLCYFDGKGGFHGFRVNRVEGDRVFWRKGDAFDGGAPLQRGTPLFRNHDKAFADMLAGESAERTLPLDFSLAQQEGGFELLASDGERVALVRHDFAAEPARTPQADNIRRQLSRLGDTPFRLRHLDLRLQGNPFIPSSTLAAWRREAVAALVATDRSRAALPPLEAYGQCQRDATQPPLGEVAGALMTCRHCLRHALDACPRRTGRPAGPLFLRMPDGRRLALRFDCQACLMTVWMG